MRPFLWIVLALVTVPTSALAQSDSQTLDTVQVTAEAVTTEPRSDEAPAPQPRPPERVGGRISMVATGSSLFTVSYGLAITVGLVEGSGCCGNRSGAAAVIIPGIGPLIAQGLLASQPSCFCSDGGIWAAAFLDSLVQLGAIALIAGGSAGRPHPRSSQRESAWLVLPGTASTPLGLSLVMSTY